MSRRMVHGFVVGLIVLAVAGIGNAHECDPDTGECKDTTVVENWRGSYVPVFDLADREDPEQRARAQRWRDECQTWREDGTYEARQICQWSYGGFSLFPNRDGSDPAPNEWHVGFAATHCFLFEAAHQCEDHEPGETSSDRVHDAHGGAIYIDLCLTPNPESKWCRNGMADTQVGVTILDHNACGPFVPIVACTDEYKIIRPFDGAYTQEQFDDSLAWVTALAANPRDFLRDYVCGYERYRAFCLVP